MYGRLTSNIEIFDKKTLRFTRQLTFEVDPDEVRELPEHCEIFIEKWSPDRGMSQNAKYWSVVNEIAKLTRQPKSAVHNHLLNEYGEIEYTNGEPVVIVLKSGYNYLTDSELHLMPTGRSFTQDDTTYDIYFKLKNSQNLTRKQFSRLIDGALETRRELDEV